MSKTSTNEKKKKTNVREVISPSKRLTLTYIVMFIWLCLGLVGIFYDVDLAALAAYFSSSIPPILGYMWSETRRPSGYIKESYSYERGTRERGTRRGPHGNNDDEVAEDFEVINEEDMC